MTTMTKAQWIEAVERETETLWKVARQLDALNMMNVVDDNGETIDEDRGMMQAMEELEDAVEDLAIADLVGLDVKR